MIRPFVGMLGSGSLTDQLASGPHQPFASITLASQIRYPSSTVSGIYIEKRVWQGQNVKIHGSHKSLPSYTCEVTRQLVVQYLKHISQGTSWQIWSLHLIPKWRVTVLSQFLLILGIWKWITRPALLSVSASFNCFNLSHRQDTSIAATMSGGTSPFARRKSAMLQHRHFYR
jgi:hypothetical protein